MGGLTGTGVFNEKLDGRFRGKRDEFSMTFSCRERGERVKYTRAGGIGFPREWDGGRNGE